jgi:hypothetical protein
VQAHPSWTANWLREYLAERLEKEGARNVVIDDKRIRFEGRMWEFDVIRWHFLHGISKGKVAVDYRNVQVHVAYQISFIGYVVLFLVLMGLVALVSFGFSGSSFFHGLGMFIEGLYLFGLFIGVQIGINYYRFNRFIKSCLREFFNSAANSDMHGELITSR